MDIVGETLQPEERKLLQHPAVAGVILFSRNYADFSQLKALTSSIREIKPDVLLLVDQEGGPVQRFRTDFTSLPSMREWGERYRNAPQQTTSELRGTIKKMVQELQKAHIHASLMPVLDVDYGVSHVIGERSIGRDIDRINQLAGIIIETFQEQGMPSTGKHFPGHGAVTTDSHQDLPVDERSFAEIAANDLQPYQALVEQLGAIIPAHIVYKDVDSMPAGFSKKWLNDILRDQLGFKGAILSDDLNMKAAAKFGDFPTRAQLALEAGCDALLVCNNRSGVEAIIKQIGDYQNTHSLLRLNHFIHSK